MVQPINLPENPTPEQYEQLEPIVVQAMIEQYYRDGIQPLQRVGGAPNRNEYQRLAPGQFTGVFSSVDGKTQFAFEITSQTINYTPLTPETIEAMESDQESASFAEKIKDVSPETRLGVFHRRGVDGLVELYEWIDED